ncbi:MAG TPA: PA14 domain-containing protein [Candidatus Binataceae bacterium]
MTPAEQHTRRIERTLFLIPFLSYAYFYQASDQSIAARFDLMRSMLERRALWIDGYCGYNTADIISFNGHYYSVKAPGTSLTALLPWSLVRAALMPLFSRNEPLYWALATWLTIIFTTGVLIAILAVLMYRFARFLGASEGRSAALALIVALGTICFPYATQLSGEPVAAATAFAAFYLLATFDTAPDAERAFWAGFLAGWAVLNDYPALLIAAAIGIYAMFKLPRLSLLTFAAGAAITAGLMMLYNWGAFGSAFFMSYEAFKLTPGNTQFPEQARGFVGLTYPKMQILWAILFDPQRGLFYCNPVLLLAIPGAVYFARRGAYRAEMAVTVFSFAAMILFNASYGESIISWGGGTATGPRQVIAGIPFMVLTLAFLPASWDYVLGAMGALSAAIMLIATATNPHFPYEYDNPVRDFALQQYLRGDFAGNRDTYFGGGNIVGDSVAFNLGKLAGLPPALQLWPLGALWIAGAFALVRALAIWPRRAMRRLRSTAFAVAIAIVFVASLTGAIVQPLELTGNHGLLGRYYVGEQPGASPPHIVRIDPEMNFDDIAQMGAMPFPSVAVWTGSLIVPREGRYGFAIDVDDSGWLKIDGHPVIYDPGSISKPHDQGAMFLTAGRHRIEVGERNIAGGSYLRLFWQPPSSGEPEIIPSAALVPERTAR